MKMYLFKVRNGSLNRIDTWMWGCFRQRESKIQGLRSGHSFWPDVPPFRTRGWAVNQHFKLSLIQQLCGSLYDVWRMSIIFTAGAGRSNCQRQCLRQDPTRKTRFLRRLQRDNWRFSFGLNKSEHSFVQNVERTVQEEQLLTCLWSQAAMWNFISLTRKCWTESAP